MRGEYEISGTAVATCLLASLYVAAGGCFWPALSSVPGLRHRLRIRLEWDAADRTTGAAGQRGVVRQRVAQVELLELEVNRPAQNSLRSRAPRVTPPQGAFASIQLENGRQLTAALKRISLTGGLVELAAYVEERVAFGFTLSIGSDVVHGRAETLFPMRSVTGYLQPFRFTFLRPEQVHILNREINELAQLPHGAATGQKVELGSHLPSSLLELL